MRGPRRIFDKFVTFKIEDCKVGANDWATKGNHFFVDETDPVVEEAN